MAEISSTPDLKDPLGAPNIITGTEYMGALAKLGYNVENMTSMLPTITKIAESGSSLLNQTYQQNLAYQEAQSKIGEAAARTKLIDSEADYNTGTMQYRIDNEKYDSLTKKLDLDKATRTQEASIARLLEQDAHGETMDKQAEEKGRIDQNKDLLGLQMDQLDTQLAQKAQVEQQQALAEAAKTDITDPDYFAKKSALIAKYPNAFNNKATKDAMDAFWSARDASRQNNIDVQNRLQRMTSLDSAIQARNLPANTDKNLIANNAQLYDRTMAQSRVTDSLNRVQGLIGKLRSLKPLPAGLAQQATDLTAFRDRLKDLLTPDDAGAARGMSSILSGGQGDVFDTHGNMNPELEGDMQALEDYYAGAIRAEGRGKPTTTTIDVRQQGPVLDPTHSPLTIKAENVPLDQADTVRRRLQNQVERGVPAGNLPQGIKLSGTGVTTEQNTAQTAVSNEMALTMQNLADFNPAFRDMLARAKQTGDWTEVRQTLGLLRVGNFNRGGFVPGYQTGGDVTPLQGSADAPGSTDTVTIGATPGEFVLTKPATDSIRNAFGDSFLSAMNQRGAGALGGDVTRGRLPFNPIPGSIIQPMPVPQQLTSLAQNPNQTPAQTGAFSDTGTAAQPAVSGTTTTTQPASIASTGAATGTTNITPATGNWSNVIGSEFGEVDNPKYGGYTEANWDKGAWGDNLAGWDTQGVALRGVPQGTVVEVRNPKTGQTVTATVKDKGPGESTGASIDMLAGTRSALGLPRDFKGQIQYRIVSQPGQQTAGMQFGGPVTAESPPTSYLQRGGMVAGYSPQTGSLGGSTPSIAADLSTLPEGNPLYGPSTARTPVTAPGFQGGGIVTGGELGAEGVSGRRGPRGQAGGGGGGGWLPQTSMRHKRFHPRLPGQMGPEIPDEMQKKLAKLSHDYLSGVSGLIQQRPEMGPGILRHARNQIASNLGTGAEDEEQGAQQQEGGYGLPSEDQQYSQAQYAMTAMGGDQSQA